jgi:3-hydroxyisobutyrate dehydrogenase-like beta-hydroxyacid dehydrogenase
VAKLQAKVGVIGLGALGLPITRRLMDAGCTTAVYDVRLDPVRELAALGANPCSSPADVARVSDLIISLVSDAQQTDAIVSGPGGILETLRPDTVFATGSTLGPGPVLRVAQQIAAKGGHTLDIPISGGILAAREGLLSLMVGGDPELLASVMPILKVFADNVTHTGDVGTGQVAKLAHQLVFSTHVMALLEGLALAEAGGVAPDVMKLVLKQGLANSSVLQIWHELGPRWKGMLEAKEAGEPLPNMRKDLHLVLEMAQKLGVELPVGSNVSQVADSGKATGHKNPEL